MLKFRRAQDLVSGSIQAPATMEATLEQITEFYLQHKDPVRKAQRVVAKKGLNSQVSVPALKPKSVQASKPCHSKRWTELHHIQPVAQGGRHELKNLVTLCSAHHDFLHVQTRGGLGAKPVPRS